MRSIVNTSGTFGLYAFDRLIIGYCLLMVAILFLVGRSLSEYGDEIVFYASVAAIATLIVRYVPGEGQGFPTAVRLLYPAALFLFFYRQTGGTMFLVFDGFLDEQLTAFEKAVFGFNPTIYIDRHLLNVWLNEIFSLGYFAYYFLIPLFLLAVFCREEYDLIKSYLCAACLAFFFSYILFFLYPLEGPRWHFALEYAHTVEGPVFRPLTEFVIAKGAVRGGCMPSSHFAVALVTLMFCFRYYRRAGWALLPVVTALAIGTVWGRYHYVSDVIVGGLIGLATTLATWRYRTVSTERSCVNTKIKESAAENVS